MLPIKCSADSNCNPRDVSLPRSQRERHQTRSKRLNIPFIEKITGISEPSLVQALDITNRDLSSWEARDFKGYINLKDIEAGGNCLSLDAFIYLQNLQALNLQCNNITVFQIDCLSDHFKHLKILDLSYNALNSDAIIKISELPNLYKLNLSGNDIDWFPDCADIAQAPLPSTTVADRFQGFPKLQYLDLDSNRITDQLSITHISKLPSLRCLRLDNNQLPSLICLQPVEQEDFMFEGFKQSKSCHSRGKSR
ncbi:hypothetical protein BKA69DRAFT_398326 [Paraphysoderma sedebokerense]|nr:hypothetical protein BKA69DRAFT_398326 [Paraphysoderma sedebokerense]